MAVVCIPTNLVESIILRRASQGRSWHAKGTRSIPPRRRFHKASLPRGRRENVSIYRSLFPARLFKKGGNRAARDSVIPSKCRCTRSTLRSSSHFYDSTLAMNYATIPLDIPTLTRVNKRSDNHFPFIRCFEYIRDPLSVD